MNEESKQKIYMFLAIFTTMILIMQVFAPPQKPDNGKTVGGNQAAQEGSPEENKAGSPLTSSSMTAETGPTAVTNGSVGVKSNEKKSPVSIADESTVKQSKVVDGITVRMMAENNRSFEAVFTTDGAALTKFTLLDYYRTPESKAGEELVVLDEMARGRYSMVIETVNSADVRHVNYQLVAAPAGAELPEGAEVRRTEDNTLVFRAMIDQWLVTKIFEFSSEYALGFRVVVKVENHSSTARKFIYSMVGPSSMLPDDDNRWSTMEVMSGSLKAGKGTECDVLRHAVPMLSKSSWFGLSRKSDIKFNAEIEEAVKRKTPEAAAGISWIGVKNRFFTTVMTIDEPANSLSGELSSVRVDSEYRQKNEEIARILKAHILTGEAAVKIKDGKSIAPGQAAEYGYRFYAGPADEKVLAFDPRLGDLVSYTWSWFNGISRFLVGVLDWIASIIPNYGIAIILLTLLVKTVMHPLTRKSLTSSHKMQQVAPIVKEIQKKYKNDRERMSKEMMRVYGEHGVSPMSGCLPVFIQLPIFFSLYGCFARGFSIRHALFVPGWIEDLAIPDRLFSWATPLPFVGWTSFNLLPIIYVILSVVQMSMQPKSNDPQVQQQQKMMKFMPVMFFFIFYTMPSGLVLYFCISSIYTLVEHYVIKRHLKDGDGNIGGLAAARAAGGNANAGSSAGVGFQQNSDQGGKNKKKKKKK